MIFTMEMLLYEMKVLSPFVNRAEIDNIDVCSLLLFSDEKTKWKSGQVYLCTEQQLIEWNNQDESLTFFAPDMEYEHIKHIKNQCVIFKNAESILQITDCYLNVLGFFSAWDRGIHRRILNENPNPPAMLG